MPGRDLVQSALQPCSTVPDPRGLAHDQRRRRREIAGRGPATVVSVLIGQVVSLDRVFMTFIETPELDRVYHEAEAILLADRRNRAF